jgi:flagellar protein FliS
MKTSKAKLAYQEAEIRGASQIRLVIMMYDMMIDDLRHAIDYLRAGDVQARTDSTKHAIAVLEQLQGTLNMDSGGDAARNFDQLYSMVRAKLLEAQIKCSAEIMKSQMDLLTDLRTAWKQAEEASQNANGSAVTSKAEDFEIPQTDGAVYDQSQVSGAMRDWTA